MREHAKAKAWAARHGFTQKEVADLTGYAPGAVFWFFKGLTPPQRNAKSGNEADRQIKPWVWMRFKRACGDVDAEINGRKKGERFDW